MDFLYAPKKHQNGKTGVGGEIIMKVYGLTGGIASGKSTVSYMFEELGATVLDADQLARQIVEPGTREYNRIIDAFGRKVLLEDGRLDRRKLRRIVFANEKKRAILNEIVHPEVMRQSSKRMSLAAESGVRVLIYEAALLVETGMYKNFDGLIVVTCDVKQQRERLMARDHVNTKDIDNALASQSSHEEKLLLADHVIDTKGTHDETRSQVQSIWRTISG